MDARIQQEVLGHLDSLLKSGHELLRTFIIEDEGDDGESEVPEHELRAFLVASAAELVRVVGRESEYVRQLPPAPGAETRVILEPILIQATLASLSALRSAVADGRLDQLAARVRSAVHDDMLQQATGLLDAQHHVAAMVIIGGVLESRLRYLCEVRKLTPPKANLSAFNDALRDHAYPTPIWREIQVVGDRRNDAAHGHYDRVTIDGVQRALEFVRAFLAQHAA